MSASEEPTGRLHRLDLTLALHADQGGKTTLIYCRFKSVWMHHLIYVKHIASELPLSSERDSRCFESSGLCQISPALWLPCVSSNCNQASNLRVRPKTLRTHPGRCSHPSCLESRIAICAARPHLEAIDVNTPPQCKSKLRPLRSLGKSQSRQPFLDEGECAVSCPIFVLP